MPSAQVQIIDLPEPLFARTRQVEYSMRKYLRFLYYGEVFRYLKQKIDDAMETALGPVVVYTTDEGVWTEYTKHILQSYESRKPVLVNVQHGLHFLESPSVLSVAIRSILNQICCSTVGFPIYGFGLGGSRCDYYLVYGHNERRFIESKGLKAFVASRLIKARFMAKVQQIPKMSRNERIALFALQPISKEAGFSRTESDFYRVLLPVAASLKEMYGFTVFYRPHPGMDLKVTRGRLERAGLLQYGEIQDYAKDVTLALVESDILFSHSSTVLLEALLAGKISVQLLEFFDSKRIHLPIQYLCLEDNDHQLHLANILNCSADVLPADQGDDIINWSNFLSSNLGFSI